MFDYGFLVDLTLNGYFLISDRVSLSIFNLKNENNA